MISELVCGLVGFVVGAVAAFLFLRVNPAIEKILSADAAKVKAAFDPVASHPAVIAAQVNAAVAAANAKTAIANQSAAAAKAAPAK